MSRTALLDIFVMFWVLAAFVLANFAYQAAQPFYNAMMPELVAHAKQGRLSGFGTALGYVEGKSIVMEYRWADGHTGRLPDLADELVREIEALGLRIDASPFWRGTIACTGSEFCKIALTETKGFARWMVEDLEMRLPGFDQHVKINITGCPNSCGQHWIADLGLELIDVSVVAPR